MTRTLAEGRGLIIAAPHYGNWELLIEYLASRAPFTLVYRVPETRAGDVFLRRARGGANVQLVPAESNAMRPLWRALKAGEIVGITPDQQPKFGGGVFAPFFGKAALTLSLIPKLAERSGAPVLFAYAEPVPGGFEIRLIDIAQGHALRTLLLEDAAYRAALKKLPRFAALDARERKRKLMEFLARNGFGYDVISSVVTKILNEELED